MYSEKKFLEFRSQGIIMNKNAEANSIRNFFLNMGCETFVYC